MMLQRTDHDRVSIISPKFCKPHPLDLVITKNVWQLRPANFVVKDTANGKTMFRIEGSVFSFDRKRVMFNAAGVPIVTLREKILSVRSRWEVYRGEGKGEKDLIFSARRSSIFQMKTKLSVFIAKNKSQNCNYTVQGSWFERSCEVYAGNSSSIIAQMNKNCSVSSLITGKGSFTVTVNPNIDCAFIVALVVILDEIVARAKRSSDYKRKH